MKHLPELDNFGNYISDLIPFKFRGEFGYRDNRMLGLTEITDKELGELKYWLIRAIPFVQDYAIKLENEKKLSYPQTDDSFRSQYNNDVCRKINLVFDHLTSLNEDIIKDENTKKEFYRTIESERSRYLNDIFSDFNTSPISTKEGSARENGRKTLQSKLNRDQLIHLHQLLLSGGYIKEYGVADFEYMMTGKPSNGIQKIYWKKSKRMLVYLLDKICPSFRFPIANNCFDVKGKPLDSNDRKDVGYAEIDKLLKGLK